MMDISDARLEKLTLEIATINLMLETTEDEILKEHLMLRKDVLDNEVMMILDSRAEENERVQKAIDDLLESI